MADDSAEVKGMPLVASNGVDGGRRPSTPRDRLSAAKALDAELSPAAVTVKKEEGDIKDGYALDGERAVLRMGKKIHNSKYALVTAFQNGKKLRFVIYSQEHCIKYEIRCTYPPAEEAESVERARALCKDLVDRMKIDETDHIVFGNDVAATWTAT